MRHNVGAKAVAERHALDAVDHHHVSLVQHEAEHGRAWPFGRLRQLAWVVPALLAASSHRMIGRDQ